MSIKSIVAKNDFIIQLKLVKNKIVTISQQGLMEGDKTNCQPSPIQCLSYLLNF